MSFFIGITHWQNGVPVIYSSPISIVLSSSNSVSQDDIFVMVNIVGLSILPRLWLNLWVLQAEFVSLCSYDTFLKGAVENSITRRHHRAFWKKFSNMHPNVSGNT